MTLTNPPDRYDRNAQARWKAELEAADIQNVKRNVDLELGSGSRLILKSPNGSRFSVVVDNSGALSTVAL